MWIERIMTIARRSLEAEAVLAPAVTPVPHPRSQGSTTPPCERTGVPGWALAAGIVLVLAFAGLVVQTYADRSLRAHLDALLPAARTEQLASPDQTTALYVAGSTVQAGQVGIGSRGQDRTFQAGDVVLLGDTGRLVRIEESGRLTELRAAEGASLRVTSLGTWDQATDSLTGMTARFVGGAWAVDGDRPRPVGASLLAPGAPEEELTPDFRLTPATAGRIRRYTNASGPGVRIRPTGRTEALLLEGWDPLPSLDSTTVTIEAVVRVSEGATVELALNDVVDAAGTVQRTVDSRDVTDEGAWMTLRVQRRVRFGSPGDRYTLGLLDVRNRDWLEVRDLAVYIGSVP